MPSKNVVKYYIENGYYHVYNRGVEKRNIFEDRQDYNVFTSFLRDYLLPKDADTLMKVISDLDSTPTERDRAAKLLRLNNFSDEVQMIAYCLMPNHFHFLIKQRSRNAIDQLMNSLGTRYTMYFNKKNARVGRLYQDVYKAVEVEQDEYLLHLSRYIHKQALEYKPVSPQPSSYEYFVRSKTSDWIHPEDILAFFSGKYPVGYETFMSQKDELDLSNLLLEDS